MAKFTITMKDPDGFSNSIDEAASTEGQTDNERDDAADELRAVCKTWFRWDEYLTVEVDTEAMTCTVKKVSP